MSLNLPAGAPVAPQRSDNQPRFVLKCGSLFLGLEGAPRVASADRARKMNKSEAEVALKLLTRRNAAFVMPWTIEPANAEGGGE
ncbi:hypothetical protein [Terriglobus aquaticus]|uniref:Uncharacterized protein n=1 Tax=Terriglobus aquaticus TaxID=940139 RepID=A0ABW9KH97_9BACT|nr:hypothetical protein [Terriglobus aquaticus]